MVTVDPQTIAALIGRRPERTAYPLVCPRCWRPVLVTERIHLAEIGPRPVGRPAHWKCRAPRHAARPGLLHLTTQGRHLRDLALAGTAAGTAIAAVELLWWLR